MLSSAMLLNGTVMVELNPLDARTRAYLDPTARRFGRSTAQGRHHGLQQQRQQQHAGKISATD